MKARRVIARQDQIPAPLLLLLACVSFMVAACGSLELGVEETRSPDVAATATMAALATENAQLATRVAAFEMTPTSTQVPTHTAVSEPTSTSVPSPTAVPFPTSSTTPMPTLTQVAAPTELQVAFIKDEDVWLWIEGGDGVPLTRSGGALDVRISDDGAIVAFVREDGLWTVRSDGTEERELVSAADFADMEPRDPLYEGALHRFDWIPGTHILAFNTRLLTEIGLMLRDDLRLVNSDTLERTNLLPPGEGGEFHFSPDGRQVAVVTAGSISLIDVDGGNRREVFTYTPVMTASEVRFYARPCWAADSGSLRVAIPPVDAFTDSPQSTSLWHVPTDGTPAGLVGSITAAFGSQYVFSPDASYVVYLQHPAGDATGASESALVVTHVESGETVHYASGAHAVYGWAPDSMHFAFLANPQLPQAQIGQLDGDVTLAHGDKEAAAIDVTWVDAERYLFLAKSPRGWDIVLSTIGGPYWLLAAATGSPPAYDFTR